MIPFGLQKRIDTGSGKFIRSIRGTAFCLILIAEATFDYYKPPNGYPAPQGGLMGLAIHPKLLRGSPYVFVALVYDLYGTTGTPNNSNCAGSGSLTNQPCYYKTKILRYTYNLVTHFTGYTCNGDG